MGTLLLKLAGPLQSWGADSKYTERKTRHEPTKSGIVGLLAAALGRTREDDIDDLAQCPIAVRVDQPGHYEHDFQMAHERSFDKYSQGWKIGKGFPLSNRYYLADAVFVVGVFAPDDMLEHYANALQHPAFPLFLGRRSCPPAGKLFLGAIGGASLMGALSHAPWQATDRKLLYGRRNEKLVRCEVLRDQLFAEDELEAHELVRDYPLSFSQVHRQYMWRTVVHTTVDVPNPHYVSQECFVNHDPMAALGEV